MHHPLGLAGLTAEIAHAVDEDGVDVGRLFSDVAERPCREITREDPGVIVHDLLVVEEALINEVAGPDHIDPGRPRKRTTPSRQSGQK